MSAYVFVCAIHLPFLALVVGRFYFLLLVFVLQIHRLRSHTHICMTNRSLLSPIILECKCTAVGSNGNLSVELVHEAKTGRKLAWIIEFNTFAINRRVSNTPKTCMPTKVRHTHTYSRTRARTNTHWKKKKKWVFYRFELDESFAWFNWLWNALYLYVIIVCVRSFFLLEHSMCK